MNRVSRPTGSKRTTNCNEKRYWNCHALRLTNLQIWAMQVKQSSALFTLLEHSLKAIKLTSITWSTTRRVSVLACFLSSSLLVSGCAQMIADKMYGDQYLKPISMSREIASDSQKSAVSAAVAAAGKTQWSPKTISVETGYMFAEWTPPIFGMNAARNYAFKLEARLPESGKGTASVSITPPQGLVSKDITMEGLATKYLDALDTEVKAKKK